MSLALQYHNENKAIHQRIAAKAAEHEASKRTALVAELKECCEPKPKPEPVPEPIEDGWVNRQISGERKQLWFSVLSAVKVTPSGALCIRTIQRTVCDVYGVEMSDLLSARRTANVVRPRQVSMYLARELTALSLPRIARATGDRDHTTTYHAHRKIERLLKSDDELAAKIALIKERLG